MAENQGKRPEETEDFEVTELDDAALEGVAGGMAEEIAPEQSGNTNCGCNSHPSPAGSNNTNCGC
jgi:hypothetical protein